MAIINDNPIPPPIIYVEGKEYPGTSYVIEKLRSIKVEPQVINATKLAEESLGDPRPANVILIGYALKRGFLGISEESVRKAIEKVIRKKYVEMNLKALEIGMSL